MALAANWVVNGTSVTGSALIYTVSSTGYKRDLVITNGGPSTCFYALGTGATGGATVTSFGVPSGGSVILTQCQVPAGGIIGAISAGTSATSIGFGSLVNYT